MTTPAPEAAAAAPAADAAQDLFNAQTGGLARAAESVVEDITSVFASVGDGRLIAVQFASIVIAVLIGIAVHRLLGARLKALGLRIGGATWQRRVGVLGLSTLYDILFSATSAALLSLFVQTLMRLGMVAAKSDLFFVHIAYQIFFAWAILLVLMRFLSLILGSRFFGPGVKRVVRTGFWVLAALQMLDILPDIVDWMRSCQLPIGTDKLTVWALLVGFITLFVALGIAVRISSLCEKSIMGMHDLEMNTRVVFTRLCRVAFLVLGTLVGLSSAGIDLTILSVFGGALGVGIGFGMQKIASNYISGFIILCDKSVKIGDMVDVAGFTGIITQINTRYSVLRNTSGEEMIVPNENFVTGSVRNFSLTDAASLITLDVSCAYESDVDEALRILSECVMTEPRVLKGPGHSPWFAVTEFAASGINLRAAFWIDDPRRGTVVVKSDIFRKVLKAYQQAGIEIPYDKLDVTIKNPPSA